jgi:hypothetical protein
MRIWKMAAATVLLGVSGLAQAALLLRDINGNPVANAADATFVYDDQAKLTWLRDWSAAGSDKNWGDSVAYADNLIVGSFSDWRLPTADPSCIPSTTFFAKCTTSEIGNLWYNVLLNTEGVALASGNHGPFINVKTDVHWYGTEQSAGAAYYFSNNGRDAYFDKTFLGTALAVRDGDVSVVPLPAAGWLLLSGLGGLGLLRRRRVN